MSESTSAKSDGLAASPMDRRDFLKGAASAAGTVAVASVSETARAAPTSKPGVPWDPNSRMGIGINLEYVRHADKSLAYSIKRAGQIGYNWIEPCFLDGRCLLSNSGYCHVTSMDTDPNLIRDLCAEAGVKISGLSSHSDLLNPEYGVLYARRGIRYARALGVNVVQITEDMYPPKWIDEFEAYNIMRITLRAIAETCEENGVYIAVEQHGPYTAKIEHMKRILSLVDSPWIKCNFDCGNTFLLIAVTPSSLARIRTRCSKRSLTRSCMCTRRTSRSSRPRRSGARSLARPLAVRAATASLTGRSSLGG